MVSISIAQPSNEEEIKLRERELFQYISMPLRFATNLKTNGKTTTRMQMAVISIYIYIYMSAFSPSHPMAPLLIPLNVHTHTSTISHLQISLRITTKFKMNEKECIVVRHSISKVVQNKRNASRALQMAFLSTPRAQPKTEAEDEE